MILGSRGSPLALTQTRWTVERLRQAHPAAELSIQIIRTTGDRQQAESSGRPFGAGDLAGGKGIFVKEIEEALIRKRVDAAVHSLKDLPTGQPDGLILAAIPARVDPRDALVTMLGAGLDDLPAGARVGTGSPRRTAQLLAARPDLIFVPVRGNVDTRIRKMAGGEFEAVVLAMAGMTRLGLLGGSDEGRMRGARAVPLAEEICLPAVGQGALAIECRSDDLSTQSLLAVLEDASARLEVEAERSFLAALGGGCRVPVAARAKVSTGRVALHGLVASTDGRSLIAVQAEAESSQASQLGWRLAEEALARGAAELLRGSGA